MCVCLRACVCACVYVRVYLSPPPPTLSPSIRSRRWNLKWCELSGMELKMYVFNSPTGPAPALVGLDVDNAADDESRHGGQRSTSGGRRRYRRVINAFGRQTHDQRGHRTSGYAFCFLRAVRANSWPRGLCVCARTAPSWASRARKLLAGGNPRAERGR